MIAFFIRKFQAKAFTLEMIANLFKVNLDAPRNNKISDTSLVNVFNVRMSLRVLRLKGWSWFQHMFGCLCTRCFKKRDKNLHQALKFGEKKIAEALDTRRIVRYERALKTLTKLSLSKESCLLVHLQRSTSVIDLFKDEGSSSS